MDTIRTELSNKLRRQGRIGVVPEEEIQKVLHRRVVEMFLEKKRILRMSVIYHALNSYRMFCRSNVGKGDKQRFRRLAGKCFYAWSDHTYMVAIGLDRKRWIAPRKYEVRMSYVMLWLC